LDFPDPDSPAGRIDFENGREGDVFFVSGMIKPTVTIRSGEIQRWRIINASAARVYRLAVPGMQLLHVGSDGGLFEHPVSVDEVVLAVGDRVEVLVRGSGLPGSRSSLRLLPYDRYIPQTRPSNWQVERELAVLQYSSEPPVEPAAIPARLRAVPAIDTTAVTTRRVVSLTQGMINGRLMDMTRIDFHGNLGATEVWEIENLVGMDHPFHLHGFQFQVLDRNGVPERDARWEDTINVPKHETARLVVRFDDFPGRWMFHCHILSHEDHGMMGVLLIQ
jgi:FtsP/CotA-like multicopper oxidase with cupredoxin domain